MSKFFISANVKAYPQWGIKSTKDEIRTEL